MVAFNLWGAGHYDGVIQKDAAVSTAEPVKCSCGKNTRDDDIHCHVIKNKYTEVIRCTCVKNGTACNVNCRCKNCKNPCGQRPSSVDTPQRKRAKHDWQAETHMKSIDFALSRQEQLSDGPLEFFLLENILVYCDEEGIEATPLNISAICHRIIASVNVADPNLQLRKMTKHLIELFLKHHRSNLTTFKMFCDMQLDWNKTKEK